MQAGSMLSCVQNQTGTVLLLAGWLTMLLLHAADVEGSGILVSGSDGCFVP